MAQLMRHAHALLDLTALDGLEAHLPFGMLLKELAFEKYKSHPEASSAEDSRMPLPCPRTGQRKI